MRSKRGHRVRASTRSSGGFLNLADHHHFGRRVEPTERASFLYFKKPRTVFWERLFFGVESPLRPLLQENFFKLEFVDEAEWSGLSKQLNPVEGAITEAHFKSFGALLGYAYVFGLRDLHRENLIRCENHIQVIDAEVVLTDLRLPQETLLLPFKECGWTDCGLSKLAPSSEAVSTDQARALMAGFIQILENIHRRREDLKNVLQKHCQDSPIRILFRATQEYTSHLRSSRSSSSTPFLREELLQMERGDVPYFFKRLGSEDVFWVSDFKGPEPVFTKLDRDKVSPTMSSDIARHAVGPEVHLASDARIEDRLVRGLMVLLGTFALPSQLDFEWMEKRLEVKPEGLYIEALNQRFVLRRSI